MSNGNVSAGAAPPTAPRDPLEELYGSPEPQAQPSTHLCPRLLILPAMPLPPTAVLFMSAVMLKQKEVQTEQASN